MDSKKRLTYPRENREKSLLEVNEKKVKWAIEMGELGFPVTKSQLIDSVTKLVKNLNRKSILK